MYLCSCAPGNQGLTPAKVVETVRDGASRLRDVVEKTNAGNKCKTCRPRLAKLNSTIQALAAERDAAKTNPTAPAWPTDDQMENAEARLSKAAAS